jgi:hypothetical protein
MQHARPAPVARSGSSAGWLIPLLVLVVVGVAFVAWRFFLHGSLPH